MGERVDRGQEQWMSSGLDEAVVKPHSGFLYHVRGLSPEKPLPWLARPGSRCYLWSQLPL